MSREIAGVDYIGASVAFLVIHPDDDPKWGPMNTTDHRFLFSKRGPGCRNEVGKWEFGGGEVNYGETIKEAVTREVNEEYGLEVYEISEGALVEQFIEGQQWWCHVVVAFVKDTNIKISEPEKVVDPAWMNAHEAFENLDMSQAAENAWEAWQG